MSFVVLGCATRLRTMPGPFVSICVLTTTYQMNIHQIAWIASANIAASAIAPDDRSTTKNRVSHQAAEFRILETAQPQQTQVIVQLAHAQKLLISGSMQLARVAHGTLLSASRCDVASLPSYTTSALLQEH